MHQTADTVTVATGSLPAADASLPLHVFGDAHLWTLMPTTSSRSCSQDKSTSFDLYGWKCSWRLQSIQQFKFNAVCHVYGTVAVNFNLLNIVLFWETQRGSVDMDLWNTGCMSVFSKGMQLWLGLLHCGLDNTKFMAQMHQ